VLVSGALRALLVRCRLATDCSESTVVGVVTSPAKSVNAVSTCTGAGTAADIIRSRRTGRDRRLQRAPPPTETGESPPTQKREDSLDLHIELRLLPARKRAVLDACGIDAPRCGREELKAEWLSRNGLGVGRGPPRGSHGYTRRAGHLRPRVSVLLETRTFNVSTCLGPHPGASMKRAVTTTQPGRYAPT
jgi:hypothetical protein